MVVATAAIRATAQAQWSFSECYVALNAGIESILHGSQEIKQNSK